MQSPDKGKNNMSIESEFNSIKEEFKSFGQTGINLQFSFTRLNNLNPLKVGQEIEDDEWTTPPKIIVIDKTFLADEQGKNVFESMRPPFFFVGTGQIKGSDKRSEHYISIETYIEACG